MHTCSVAVRAWTVFKLTTLSTSGVLADGEHFSSRLCSMHGVVNTVYASRRQASKNHETTALCLQRDMISIAGECRPQCAHIYGVSRKQVSLLTVTPKPSVNRLKSASRHNCTVAEQSSTQHQISCRA